MHTYAFKTIMYFYTRATAWHDESNIVLNIHNNVIKPEM